MTIDILFPTFNRLEFTKQALAALLANTNWGLVKSCVMFDDGSTDGTKELVREYSLKIIGRGAISCGAEHRSGKRLGSPAAIMNCFMADTNAEIVAKIDSDTIVPPGWLDRCAAVMQAHPELDLLGIEPPASRTPHYEGGKRSAMPELDGNIVFDCEGKNGYAPTDSIGGIGLMRTRCFLGNEPLVPNGTYGGFTSWQLERPRITKGWIVPPLDLFLLDRMPGEPWASLSKEYEANNWQRPWSKYPKDSTLWKWWTPAETSLSVPGK